MHQAGRRWMLWGAVVLISGAVAEIGGAEPPRPPLRVQWEPLTVPPATGPQLSVMVRNCGTELLQGTAQLEPPPGFQLNENWPTFRLPPGQQQRLSFEIRKGVNLERNSYPCRLSVVSESDRWTFDHSVFVGSAPYSKPVIGSSGTPWAGTIPVTFAAWGVDVRLATCWNRRAFCLQLVVQDDRLDTGQASSVSVDGDAVQILVAAVPWEDERPDPKLANRYEYLLPVVAGAAGAARLPCYRLASPDDRLSEGLLSRVARQAAVPDVPSAVARHGDATWYEFSFPWRAWRSLIQPSEGREFLLGVRVYDGQTRRLVDLAMAAGNWEAQQAYQQWSDKLFPNAAVVRPARDSRLRWGLCTSKY